MIQEKKRELYRRLRYDYYHAGRCLHLMGNFHSAGIMLGYTVETAMKAGLLEIFPDNFSKQQQRILHSHNLKAIYEECKNNNVFTEVEIPDDFLKHMDYHFQRYPSDIQKTLDKATTKNDVIGNSDDWVLYYDDLIVQLDDSLLKMTSDTTISLIYHAIRTLETRYARDILHINAAALSKFERYSALVCNNLPERDDLRKQVKNNLSKGATFYWNQDKANTDITINEIKQIKNKYAISKFKLPKWEIVDGHSSASIP